MTRKEAKNWLHKLYLAGADITEEYGDMEDMTPYEEAVNMAIKALSVEPCEYAISMSVIEDIKAEITRIAYEEATEDLKWAAGLIYSIKIINKHISGKE